MTVLTSNTADHQLLRVDLVHFCHGSDLYRPLEHKKSLNDLRCSGVGACRLDVDERRRHDGVEEVGLLLRSDAPRNGRNAALHRNIDAFMASFRSHNRLAAIVDRHLYASTSFGKRCYRYFDASRVAEVRHVTCNPLKKI